jgi:DNA-binding XRE family transcriptional regulator
MAGNSLFCYFSNYNILEKPAFSLSEFTQFIIHYHIIKARIEQNLTQEELAEKIGTKQCNISRLEGGSYNPSIRFLKKVAKGLGKKLRISLV